MLALLGAYKLLNSRDEGEASRFISWKFIVTLSCIRPLVRLVFLQAAWQNRVISDLEIDVRQRGLLFYQDLKVGNSSRAPWHREIVSLRVPVVVVLIDDHWHGDMLAFPLLAWLALHQLLHLVILCLNELLDFLSEFFHLVDEIVFVLNIDSGRLFLDLIWAKVTAVLVFYWVLLDWDARSSVYVGLN